MKTPRKPKARTYAPGQPRPCKGCKEPFTPGEAGGYGDHCNRCNKARGRGEKPGPRQRQPPGRAKVVTKTRVHPDMVAALMPDVLASYGVKNLGDFLVQSGARRLRRKEWEPRKVKKGGTT